MHLSASDKQGGVSSWVFFGVGSCPFYSGAVGFLSACHLQWKVCLNMILFSFTFPRAPCIFLIYKPCLKIQAALELLVGSAFLNRTIVSQNKGKGEDPMKRDLLQGSN